MAAVMAATGARIAIPAQCETTVVSSVSGLLAWFGSGGHAADLRSVGYGTCLFRREDDGDCDAGAVAYQCPDKSVR